VTRHLTLAEYFWLAEQVTGVDANTLAKAARSDLADSALHAPQAGFGDVEFYPEIIDLNHGTWDPDPPDIDEAEEAILAIAGGDVDEASTAAWLRERVRFVDPA
jgi:death on curing protein